jgi:hypothetical protein
MRGLFLSAMLVVPFVSCDARLQATSTALHAPLSVAVDTAGNLFVNDDARIVSVRPDGSIQPKAGTGLPGYSGDGGPALSAQFKPDLIPGLGLAVDAAGNLFIADSGNYRVRKVGTDEIIHTVAGNGTFDMGRSGDGGPANSAGFASPTAVAVDGIGNVYIADARSYRVRKITATGTITTIAGVGILGNGPTDLSALGDGGPAIAAQVQPYGIVVDGEGNLYIADGPNNRIRKITRDGIIHTFAGNGARGFVGDGGPATSAQLNIPRGVTFDAAGTLYIADTANNRIRKVTQDGVIQTVAGNGVRGFGGDGNQAVAAQLNFPWSVAIDTAGNLYIADSQNNRIRKVTSDGTIRTVAGGDR